MGFRVTMGATRAEAVNHSLRCPEGPEQDAKRQQSNPLRSQWRKYWENCSKSAGDEGAESKSSLAREDQQGPPKKTT